MKKYPPQVFLHQLHKRTKVMPKTKKINGARQGSQSVVMDQETVP